MEVSLQVGYFYNQWKTNIPANMIKHRGFLISGAWRWYGEKRIHAVSLLDDPERFEKDFRDDYIIAKTFHGLLNKADAVVAYNGDNFDMKELNASFARHKLGPHSSPIQIDPFKIAKSKFKFKGGNSLRNLCDVLDVGVQKGDIDTETWIAAAEGCKKAIRKVVKYNKGDIPTLEAVYEVLRPYVPSKFNLNHFVEEEICPSCGSPDLRNDGYAYTRTSKRRRVKCMNCGHRPTIGKSISLEAVR